MRRYYCLMLIVVLKSGIAIYAQEWTEQDSIWLQRVLNGTEKIQLNEKTLKAIESGAFIHDPYEPAVRKQLKPGSIELPIIVSFEGITAPASQHKQPYELPPAAYLLRIPAHIDSLPDASANKVFTLSPRQIAELKRLDAITPRIATVDDPTTFRSGASVGFSMEDILRSIFWPSHRAQKHNAKNANAWKTYNKHE